MIEELRDRERFKQYSYLEWGEAGVAARGWFASATIVGAADFLKHTQSVAPGEVDCLVSCHALTKIADYRAAVRETGRVLSSRGFAYLCFSNPITRQDTKELSRSDKSHDSNLRIFGRDFELELAALASTNHAASVQVQDPVTGELDVAYILTDDFFWLHRLIKSGRSLQLLEVA